MKKTYTVTFFTCGIIIAVVLAAVLSFHKSESKTLKVGFIYVGDASTSYTNNFIEVQNADNRTNTENRSRPLPCVMLPREPKRSI